MVELIVVHVILHVMTICVKGLTLAIALVPVMISNLCSKEQIGGGDHGKNALEIARRMHWRMTLVDLKMRDLPLLFFYSFIVYISTCRVN